MRQEILRRVEVEQRRRRRERGVLEEDCKVKQRRRRRKEGGRGKRASACSGAARGGVRRNHSQLIFIRHIFTFLSDLRIPEPRI